MKDSLPFLTGSVNSKKESLGPTTILGEGQFVSVLDGEQDGAHVLVDSPEQDHFEPDTEITQVLNHEGSFIDRERLT